MNSLEITSITGLTQPYQVYICNVLGQNCVLVSTIGGSVPPSVTITLPPQFENVPAVGVKIVASDGCSRFGVEYCT